MKPMKPPPIIVLLVIALVGCADSTGSNRQADPGIEGNGIEQHLEPYNAPEEVTQRLNNAPQGHLSPPAMFESRVYEGCKFRYQVYVPMQYQATCPAALMVFQDGSEVYLDFFKTPLVFDNLIHAGHMPVTIGLFIDPGTPSGIYQWQDGASFRTMEYDTIDDKYTRFLLDEIIPNVILSEYNIIDDADGWAIAGHSSGGIAAFTVGWHRPDRFHKIMTHNGSFVNIRGGDAYPELIRTADPKPLRVYLLSGTNDLNRSFGNWFEANNLMAAALEDRGYSYRYRSGTGAHYPPKQGVADYPDALRWLWRGYSLPR
jgi:enterochelin esterase family protein